MKIKISYFYQIRFFKPYQIPVSTALWDPKWYHNFKSKTHTFIDKNGVLNGVRLECFSPITCYGTKTDKRGKGCTENPETCLFIKTYREQLDNLDFTEVLNKLNNITKLIESQNEPEIILIVHESDSNPCSERDSIIEYFNKNGIDIQKFQKD